jgi:hypothetical protein
MTHLFLQIAKRPAKSQRFTNPDPALTFRHKLTGLVELQLGGRTLVLQRQEEKIAKAFELALKLSREMERRLREAFGTTDSNPHAITLPDALRALSSLCLLQYKIDEKTTVTKSRSPGPINNRFWRRWVCRCPRPRRQALSPRGLQQKPQNQKFNRKTTTDTGRKIRLSILGRNNNSPATAWTEFASSENLGPLHLERIDF